MNAKKYLKSKKINNTKYIINSDDEKIYLDKLLNEYAEICEFKRILIQQNKNFQESKNRF
jgi:hypothetical protein